jgi:5-methylcytosine-specific restriction endonuclease McrA
MGSREIKHCETCGNEIRKEPNRNWNEYAKKKYCSRKCAASSKRKQVAVACANCGIDFTRAPSQILKSGNVFCSVSCKSKYAEIEKVCQGCGNPFIPDAKNKGALYCSWDCFKESRWENVECFECGKVFSKRLSEIKKTLLSKGKHMCSRSCRNTYTSKLLGGDGYWEEGCKRPSKVKKYGKGWPAAKRYALERDEYTCQCCGSVEQLEVHHWEPYSISFDNSPENLVTLCKECHIDKHKEYRREGFYEDVERDRVWAEIQDNATR